MTTGVHGPTRAQIEEKTLRDDRWWLTPLTTFVVFSAFVVYATLRAFSGSDYYSSPYLSPFYSPCLRRLRRGLLGLRPAVRRVAALCGADHPDLPARLPADLLLLPQGLLPRVLAVAAGLRGRRAARQVLRRDPVPADPAEHPPLVLVRRGRWSPLILTFDVVLAFGREGESTGSTWAWARC